MQQAEITAVRKGRNWVATGVIDGKSASLAPQGKITRTAKASVAEEALDAVQDSLKLARAQDTAAFELELAQTRADALVRETQEKVAQEQADREAAASTITRQVTI